MNFFKAILLKNTKAKITKQQRIFFTIKGETWVLPNGTSAYLSD